MRRIFVSLICLTFLTVVSAETVKLHDGTIITGEITVQNTDSLTVSTSYGDITIPKDEILAVEYQKGPETVTGIEMKESEYVKNATFVVRPLATLVAIPYGMTELYLEGATAFTSSFSLNAVDELTVAPGLFSFSCMVGPQINLSDTYLKGVLIGVYPGIVSVDVVGYGSLTSFFVQTELAYQEVYDNGFLVGAYAGLLIADKSQIKVGIKIGCAYPDLFVRISK